MYKKIAALCMASVFTISSALTGFASVPSSNDTLRDAASSFLQNNYGRAATLENGIDLHGASGEVIAKCYQVSGGGYVIIGTKDSEVIEFSLDNKNDYLCDPAADYYYGGPLTYLEDVNGTLRDLITDEALGSTKAVSSKLRLEKSGTRSGTRGGYAVTTYRPPTYTYNVQNNCGSVAVAMYLMSLDKNFNNSYVPAKWEPTTADGQLLIKHLIPWIDSTGQGSYVGDVLKGMRNFLSESGMGSKNVTSVNGADGLLDYIIGRVSNNHPYILDMKGHPSYKNHWVTGYGYSDNFAIVNDGHGKNGIYINLVYGASLVYITNV